MEYEEQVAQEYELRETKVEKWRKFDKREQTEVEQQCIYGKNYSTFEIELMKIEENGQGEMEIVVKSIKNRSKLFEILAKNVRNFKKR